MGLLLRPTYFKLEWWCVLESDTLTSTCHCCCYRSLDNIVEHSLHPTVHLLWPLCRVSLMMEKFKRLFPGQNSIPTSIPIMPWFSHSGAKVRGNRYLILRCSIFDSISFHWFVFIYFFSLRASLYCADIAQLLHGWRLLTHVYVWVTLETMFCFIEINGSKWIFYMTQRCDIWAPTSALKILLSFLYVSRGKKEPRDKDFVYKTRSQNIKARAGKHICGSYFSGAIKYCYTRSSSILLELQLLI